MENGANGVHTQNAQKHVLVEPKQEQENATILLKKEVAVIVSEMQKKQSIVAPKHALVSL